MSTWMRSIVAGTLAAAAASAWAQAPAQPAPTTAPPGDAAELNLALEARPDGYTYNPQGRRDPFVNLMKAAVPKDTNKPSGIAGFTINEIHLRGIIEHPSGSGKYIAVMLGPDGKGYFPKAGQRLYDGVITAIDAATVYFRQEVTDPLSPEKTKEVKKTLYPTEEAGK
jgi:hypothetical protein